MLQSSWAVISLGGSVIVPDTIDTEFLKAFAALIRAHLAAGMRFIIIAGGGSTARNYQNAARELGETFPDDLDWLGIHATRLNGHLLRSVFRAEAHPKLIADPSLPIPDAKIIISAGWKPGASTDHVAVQLAKNAGAKKLINLSNIEYVYSADPHTDPTAQKIERATWAEFIALLPDHWDPGLHAPFDPVAARDAAALGMEVAVIKGGYSTEIDNYLRNKAFVGTLIA